MINTLLVATNNPGKAKEFRSLLGPVSVTIKLLKDVFSEEIDDVAETADSFAGNAELKAVAYAKLAHLPTVADDSGLEVAALDGEPGVHSARWIPGTDQDRVVALLKRMEGVEHRSAQFTCTLCLYVPKSDERHFFTGVVTGQIALEARGDQGFGYDPIFIPDGYEQTFAELGSVVKNELSHRRRAIDELLQFLKEHPIYFD